jgi:iron complex outermembrane receptor protein
MKLTYLIFSLLASCSILAQNGIIKGKIIDEKTKEELIGANVILENGKGAAADIEGNYKIEVEPGTYKVSIKFVGYITVNKTVQVSPGQTVTLNVSLQAEGAILDDVVVSASKFEQKIGEVAVSVQIIKPDLANNKAVKSPEAVVDQCPGVQMQDGNVSIRGGSGFSYGSGSRVLLMVDDMPMVAADAGDIKWGALPIENMEQMEVIKGASSVLYGSSALNGIINIRTAFPKSKPQTYLNISNGVYMPSTGTQMGRTINGKDTLLDRTYKNWSPESNYYVTGNFLHSRVVKKNLDVVVGGNFLTDKGYRMGENEHRGRINFNTRYRSKKWDGLSYGINGNYNYTVGTLFFLWQNADSVFYPSGLLNPETTTLSEYSSIRVNIDPHITYYDSSGNRHSLRTRYYNTTNFNNTNQGSAANLYYAEYQFQRKWKKDWNTTFGAMNMYSDVKADLYGDHYANNTAIFAQVDKKLKKFNFTGGLRLERYRIDTTYTIVNSRLLGDSLPFKPVFRIGSTFQAAEHTYLRASYGEGYRFPTIAERYIATNVGALNIFPNPTVGPESGWSAELGLKQGFKISKFRGYLDIAGFVTGYQDMMEFTFGFYTPSGLPWDFGPNGNNFPTLANFGAQSRNVENAIIYGGEVSVMGAGKIGEFDITLLAGYTYIEPLASKNIDSVYALTFSDSSRVLKYRMRHLFKMDLQVEYKKFAFGASARYNSFQENVDYAFVDPFLGQLLLPGYRAYRDLRRTGDIIADFRVSYQFNDQNRLSLLMNNAFNREYSNRPGNVMPPRTIIVQYALKF